MPGSPEHAPMPEELTTEPPKLELIKGGADSKSLEKPSPNRLDAKELEIAIAQDKKVLEYYEQALARAQRTGNKAEISRIENRLSRAKTNLRSHQEQFGGQA